MVVVEVRVIHQQGIELIARFKTTHLAEERSAAFGSEVEDLTQAQERHLAFRLGVVQLTYLYRVLHHTQHRHMMSGGDVGAQRHIDTCVQELTYRRHTARQVTVRHRAVHYIDAVLAHQLHLFAVRVTAVRHERRGLTEQAIAVIGIPVTGALRFELFHPVYLRAVLTQVRLYRQTGLLSVLTQGCQHLIRTGRYKARGNDRHDAAVSVFVEVCLEHAHALYQFGRRVLQRVGTVAVHTYQPHHRTHSGLDKEVRQDTGRLGVYRREDRTAHRSLHPEFVHKTTV